MDINDMMSYRWFWYVVYASPFWMVVVPYAVFQLRGAVGGLLAFCAITGLLFSYFSTGMQTAINPQATGGIGVVELFLLPAGLCFAVMTFFMCYGLERMANR